MSDLDSTEYSSPVPFSGSFFYASIECLSFDHTLGEGNPARDLSPILKFWHFREMVTVKMVSKVLLCFSVLMLFTEELYVPCFS